MHAISLAALAAVLTAPLIAQDTGHAVYDVRFESTWSSSTQPNAFPAGAHYSPLIGAVHASGATFWEPGGISSQGMERMAELGSRTVLRNEVNAEISAGAALSVIEGPGIGTPATADLSIELTPEFPLVTLVTMIAPSPDWFIGVGGLSLLEDGLWKDEVTVPLLAWDAGTDSGQGFTSPNLNTTPKAPIALLQGGPLLSGVPLGTFTLTRRHSTAVYTGSGLNPAGSLLVSGDATIGSTITVTLDDPLGVMPLPSQTFLAVSSFLPSTYPIGRTLPGFGMSAIASDGELLVGSPLRRVFGPNFMGTAVTYDVVLPNQMALVGSKLYAQGVFVSPGKIGVTEAVEIGIGL